MELICPECGANTYDQIKVYNDGMSPPSAECLECGTKWDGERVILTSASFPKGNVKKE